MPSIKLSFIFICLFFYMNGALFAEETKEQAETPPQAGPVQLVLPQRIYGVIGLEMNIYFENVALMVNRDNFLFDVTCSVGMQQQERWTYTPQQKDVGQIALQLDVYNHNYKRIASAKTILEIIDTEALTQSQNAAVTMLMIGDSLTAASRYPQRMLDLSQQKKYPQLKLIGTTGPGQQAGKLNRHEGRGGWTAQRFATAYAANGAGYNSPFLFPGDDQKPVLNFKRYCKEHNQGKAPDVVTIFLGPNDIFSATPETIDEKIEFMLTHLDQLIKMIHVYNSETLIGILMPVPPAAAQDAFGANYKVNKTRWEYRRQQHLLRTRMLAKYGNQSDKNISVVPVASNLDCLHNYPSGTVAANAHASQKISRLSNGLHPASAGYDQIGDSLYAWLCAQHKQQSASQ